MAFLMHAQQVPQEWHCHWEGCHKRGTTTARNRLYCPEHQRARKQELSQEQAEKDRQARAARKQA